MATVLHLAVVVATLALCMPLAVNAVPAELCSITPLSFEPAKTKYPKLASAITELEKYSIAAWYTDRQSLADKETMLQKLVTECSEDQRMTIVVYGLPNKDCSGGHSTGGSVKTTADYEKFIADLVKAVGDRKVLYVIEPDAIGLLAEKDGCGKDAGYLENIKIAIAALAVNKNAELYMDVGYWTVKSETQLPVVVSAMKDLSASSKLRGIVLNTSNYRTTKEISELCSKFQKAMGNTEMNCIADTSRNYLEPVDDEWCNVLTNGVGAVPTSDTKFKNLDYLMWIKVQGESDGVCNGGPDAGLFYDKAFIKLWNQGYFVKELKMKPIGDGDSDVSQTDYSDADDPVQKTGLPEVGGESTVTSEETSEIAPPPVMNCKLKRRMRKL
ncbi:hypothetical protein CCR75_001100 [Bremia lactucae]|uniref:Glycoside hydrolase n=1 Tax=Bremia lactucae TaxID=4779 RepID=A0A976IH37_BRELC|nr:hypothetical protein CCR75_001100 [Bremia lactucae]